MLLFDIRHPSRDASGRTARSLKKIWHGVRARELEGSRVETNFNRAALPLASVMSIDVMDGNTNRGYVAQVPFAGSVVGQVAGVTQVNFVVPSNVTQSQQNSIGANGRGVYFPLWVARK